MTPKSSAKLRQALHTAINSIPGCSFEGVEEYADPYGQSRYSIGADGWSPILSAIPMQWTATCLSTEEIIEQIEPFLSIQRNRAARALRYEMACPSDFKNTPPLHVQMHGAEICAILHKELKKGGKSAQANALDVIARYIRIRTDLIQNTITDHNGLAISNMTAKGYISLDDNAHNASNKNGNMTFISEIPLGEKPHLPSVINGEWLFIKNASGPLPDTVKNYAIGKCIGEIADIDPLLKPLIIQSIRYNSIDQEIRFTFKSEFISLSRIEDMNCSDAFEMIKSDIMGETYSQDEGLIS